VHIHSARQSAATQAERELAEPEEEENHAD
jgi:hypothetical protein